MSNVYFLTCINEKEKIKKFITEKNIISINHVCGIHPWLIVYKSNSINDDIKFSENHELGIGYISISPNDNKAIKKEENVKSKDYLFWIFLKDLTNEQFSSLISETINEFDITEAYQIFGEYNYIIKLYTSNINIADKFLIFCQDKKISTSTKCVLSYMQDGKEIISEKKDLLLDIKKDVDYAIARIIFNTKNFINIEKTKQKKIFRRRIKENEDTF